MWLQLRRYVFIFAFLFLMPLAFLASLKSGLFHVKAVEVLSLSETDTFQLEYISALRQKLQVFAGVNLWDAPIDEILRETQAETWVLSAKVTRRLPGTLRVELEPRNGVALVLDKKGALKVMSSDGRLLPEIPKTSTPQLPVAQDPKILRDQGVRQRIANVLESLPKSGQFSLASIAEVELDREGVVWFHHLATKSKVKLGESDVPLKAARVSRVFEYLEQNGIKSRVIDADYSRKVLVKIQSEPTLNR